GSLWWGSSRPRTIQARSIISQASVDLGDARCRCTVESWRFSALVAYLGNAAGQVRQRIGPTIKNRRHQLSMSLNTLADQAGISPSHLSRIERGLTVPSYDVLDRIADALGSDLSALRVEEEQARRVDGNLDVIFAQIGLDEHSRLELLQLSHETREALAQALQRLAA
ncbi:MAG: helix-turn-helix transcriptional regulator, partial [Thermomicrobiales bacterium]